MDAALAQQPATLLGYVVLLSPSMLTWPADFRGRAVRRLAIALERATVDDGQFVYAGYVCYWRIQEIAGEYTVSVLLGSDV